GQIKWAMEDVFIAGAGAPYEIALDILANLQWLFTYFSDVILLGDVGKKQLDNKHYKGKMILNSFITIIKLTRERNLASNIVESILIINLFEIANIFNKVYKPLTTRYRDLWMPCFERTNLHTSIIRL
ncbi:hypothetical protein ACJX0J_021119, partial [Zea mays]